MARSIPALSLCLVTLWASAPTVALSLAPEEFQASRQMACVLAQQSLGQLSEEEYGARAHTLLEDFDEVERDNIISKALGYYDGLMFSISDDNTDAIHDRLQDFIDSSTCAGGYRQVTLTL
ncbi:MAG: hypothetical protein AAGA91_13310 [Pseudomonadota bacterium]